MAMANTTKWGIVAEFDSAAAIYHAAEKVTAAGYARVDSHTPFPIHGMDRALRQGPSHLGWFVICAGATAPVRSLTKRTTGPADADGRGSTLTRGS